MIRSSVTYQMLYDIHLLCVEVYKNYLNVIEVLDTQFLRNTVSRTELLEYGYKFDIQGDLVSVNALNLLNDLCYMFGINYTNLSVSESINQILWESNVRKRRDTMPRVTFCMDM